MCRCRAELTPLPPTAVDVTNGGHIPFPNSHQNFTRSEINKLLVLSTTKTPGGSPVPADTQRPAPHHPTERVSTSVRAIPAIALILTSSDG